MKPVNFKFRRSYLMQNDCYRLDNKYTPKSRMVAFPLDWMKKVKGGIPFEDKEKIFAGFLSDYKSFEYKGSYKSDRNIIDYFYDAKNNIFYAAVSEKMPKNQVVITSLFFALCDSNRDPIERKE